MTSYKLNILFDACNLSRLQLSTDAVLAIFVKSADEPDDIIFVRIDERALDKLF